MTNGQYHNYHPHIEGDSDSLGRSYAAGRMRKVLPITPPRRNGCHITALCIVSERCPRARRTDRLDEVATNSAPGISSGCSDNSNLTT